MLNNRSLRPLLPNERLIRKDGVDLAGCNFKITGNSLANLQSSTRHLLIIDELGYYDQGTILYEIKSRTGYTAEKGNSKVVIISQAGFPDNELDLAYKEGTQEEWVVPCESCHKYIAPDIVHFTAGGLAFGDESLNLKDDKGNYVLGRLEKVLTFDCPYCQHHHRDGPQLKAYWNENGKYEVGNPDARQGHRSFHWTAIHCTKWIDLIDNWLKVCKLRKDGDTSEFIKFFQKRMARPINPLEYLNKDKVVRTDKPYDRSKWEDEFTRIFAIDVQKDRFWGDIRAYSKDCRSRQLWCGWLTTIEQVLAKQEEFNIPFSVDKLGRKTYSVVWDSGYPVRRSEVYMYCVKYNHLAIKGDTSGTKQFDRWVMVGNKKVNKPRIWTLSPTRGDPYDGMQNQGKGPTCPLVIFATDTIKKVLTQLRNGKGPEWLCLSEADNPFFKDFNAGMWNEEFYTTDKRGKPLTNGRWEKINPDITNESWDCSVYSLGAAVMSGVNCNLFDQLPSTDYLKQTTTNTETN
jgi:phage terminase large subunit GpA-like protein